LTKTGRDIACIFQNIVSFGQTRFNKLAVGYSDQNVPNTKLAVNGTITIKELADPARGDALAPACVNDFGVITLCAADGTLLRRTYVGVGPSEGLRLGRWLLITNFGEGTIAALDTDYTSTHFMTRVARFGEPKKLER